MNTRGCCLFYVSFFSNLRLVHIFGGVLFWLKWIWRSIDPMQFLFPPPIKYCTLEYFTFVWISPLVLGLSRRLSLSLSWFPRLPSSFSLLLHSEKSKKSLHSLSVINEAPHWAPEMNEVCEMLPFLNIFKQFKLIYNILDKICEKCHKIQQGHDKATVLRMGIRN